jgi:hypothetical protein
VGARERLRGRGRSRAVAGGTRGRASWIETPPSVLAISDIAGIVAVARAAGAASPATTPGPPLLSARSGSAPSSCTYLSAGRPQRRDRRRWCWRMTSLPRGSAVQALAGGCRRRSTRWLVHRGIRTLPYRMRGRINAEAVARFLAGDRRVERCTIQPRAIEGTRWPGGRCGGSSEIVSFRWGAGHGRGGAGAAHHRATRRHRDAGRLPRLGRRPESRAPGAAALGRQIGRSIETWIGRWDEPRSLASRGDGDAAGAWASAFVAIGRRGYSRRARTGAIRRRLTRLRRPLRPGTVRRPPGPITGIPLTGLVGVTLMALNAGSAP